MAVFILYTARRDANKITGGARRYEEIIKGILSRGDTIHLFAPESYQCIDHPNLVRHTIQAHESRIFPNGLLNFLDNYRILRSGRYISNDYWILFDISYGIQSVLLNLDNTVIFLRQDFPEYRKIRIMSSKRLKVVKSLWAAVYLLFIGIIEYIVIKNSHKIIVQSIYDKDIISKRHKLKVGVKKKLWILYNNVNPSWITKQDVDYKREVTRKPFHFYFIGNVNDRRKGLHLALEATKKLIDDKYPIRLNVIGSGKQLSYYQREYNRFEQIRFLGYVRDPIKKLSDADLLLVPSLADSFPNSIMEALYLEVPVIGTKVGGIPEILKYEDLLVDVSSDALYRRIKDIIDNKRWHELRKMVIERKKYFTFDWVAEIYRLLDLKSKSIVEKNNC